MPLSHHLMHQKLQHHILYIIHNIQTSIQRITQEIQLVLHVKQSPPLHPIVIISDLSTVFGYTITIQCDNRIKIS